MLSLELVKLTALMERSLGRPEIRIGLIDGPVLAQHPDLANEHIHYIPQNRQGACALAGSTACMHGTFIAGILSGKRNSVAPAICPGCTLLIRPIFSESDQASQRVPLATAIELAAAIRDCIDAGARIINLSLATAQPTTKGERELEDALYLAVRHSVIVVAAAGNQGSLGTSCITRHPWVIPVVACDSRGRPLTESNLGSSIGRRGFRAPGDGITSLGSEGRPLTLGGTSVSVPFVTGAIALLWSDFPMMNAAQIKLAFLQSAAFRRTSVTPPLLDAESAHQTLMLSIARRRTA